MQFFYKLFLQEKQPTTFKEIIYWWGERRLAFNLVIGTSGLLSIFICWIAGFEIDIIKLCIIAFTYGIAANIIYTSSWIAEYLLRKANNFDTQIKYIGPVFFAMGLAISILLTFFGGLLVGYLGFFGYSGID
ncbi:MAG: hypothetical protein IPI31_05690 [Bacteroidetes bacterium]|nr:hypothetical protein [Bacteroidota bacterium]